MKYEAVIGLEVHAQLLTDSKIFCGCSTTFGAEPNSQTCPVCLGMPGVLPVLNERAVEFAIKMGLATHCKIAPFSRFARKNYFYPDLPKGYQISQYELPLCSDGYVDIELEDGTRKRIGIIRIHLEEDAGKSIHDPVLAGEDTLVDLNRCGVPLIEIVSAPDLRSPQEAYAYLVRLKQLVTYLGICDGNMEEGSLRCDANVSVRPVGSTEFGVKTEVKNMNSFRNVERALTFEINRQIQLLESGGEVVQETLLWDAHAGEARPMRSKEEAHDYRYFPEPDLVPMVIEESWVQKIRESLPELPLARKERFMEQYKLPAYDAGILTMTRELADYYEAVVTECRDYKLASNWVMGEVLRVLNERKIEITEFPISAQQLARLLNLILDETISSKIAKTVYEEMLNTGEDPAKIVEKKGLAQVTDRATIEAIVVKVLEENPKQVEQYRSGKEKVFGYFVGQVMRATRGKANPGLVNEILKEKLRE
ncbi:MAG: Asp-tRNA(Asn)/Glu-tRNA(Gln) amidotransferase subunit GatB [Calditrichaeota bacterium]|nr:Asp-tRNA(Asn)/Glu-tRNA(Gln) amidotransferase subunit GatB [Calditrichota bacterium]